MTERRLLLIPKPIKTLLKRDLIHSTILRIKRKQEKPVTMNGRRRLMMLQRKLKNTETRSLLSTKTRPKIRNN